MKRLSSLNKIDMFTKVDPSFTRTSSAGGTVSLLTYFLIGILFILEIYNYTHPEITFRYVVDTNFDKHLDINVDMTINSPCSSIGADIMDITNKHTMYTYGELTEIPTKFEQTAEEETRWRSVKEYRAFLNNEHHNVHQLKYKSGAMFARPHLWDELFQHKRLIMNQQGNACRLMGTLTVNKVAGNFHISAGKYIPLPIGHAHVSMFGSDKAINFSHRIEKLSFGNDSNFVMNTLDGTEKITDSTNQVYQYYLKVILTDVRSGSFRTELYQYSVTEKELVVDHNHGTHGIPGIYFKYEIDGIKMDIDEDTMPFWKFLVRLCAIIGGILAISGFLNQIATWAVDVITGKYIEAIQIK